MQQILFCGEAGWNPARRLVTRARCADWQKLLKKSSRHLEQAGHGPAPQLKFNICMPTWRGALPCERLFPQPLPTGAQVTNCYQPAPHPERTHSLFCRGENLADRGLERRHVRLANKGLNSLSCFVVQE